MVITANTESEDGSLAIEGFEFPSGDEPCEQLD